MSQSQPTQPPQWRGFTEYSNSISKLLSAIKIDDSLADFIVTDRGLKIQTTANSRTYNGHLFLPKELFTIYEYECPNSEMSTTISLQAIVAALRMPVAWQRNDDAFGVSKSNIGCYIFYIDARPIKVTFAQDTMKTSTELITFTQADGFDEAHAIVLDHSSVELQVIMPAESWTNILADLDSMNALEVSLAALERPSRLVVTGTGVDASIQTSVPMESNAIEALSADPGAKFTYNFAHLKKCRDVTTMATRVSIRCDSHGTLSVQLQCDFEKNSCYVEFKFLANL